MPPERFRKHPRELQNIRGRSINYPHCDHDLSCDRRVRNYRPANFDRTSGKFPVEKKDYRGDRDRGEITSDSQLRPPKSYHLSELQFYAEGGQRSLEDLPAGGEDDGDSEGRSATSGERIVESSGGVGGDRDCESESRDSDDDGGGSHHCAYRESESHDDDHDCAPVKPQDYCWRLKELQ